MTRIHPAGRVTAPVRPVFLGLGLAQPLLLMSCGLFSSQLIRIPDDQLYIVIPLTP